MVWPAQAVEVGSDEVDVVVNAIEVRGGAGGNVCGARTVMAGIDVLQTSPMSWS